MKRRGRRNGSEMEQPAFLPTTREEMERLGWEELDARGAKHGRERSGGD